MEKKPLIILTGPTAVGKTELSIALAKKINGAIISADSMQVYRYMDIGSAKISKEEMQDVPHYLIDVLNPEDEFHVVKFKELALKAMDEIYAKGQIPIVVGGTGFYIQALLYDIDFTEHPSDEAYRQKLELFAKVHGADALHDLLAEIDLESAEKIPANNVKRCIRAMEYFHQTGEKISAHNEKERQKESPYNFCYFVLNDEREKLYERINYRVDLMEERGLEKEVRQLKAMGYQRDMVSMQGIGYKEYLDYLDGVITKEEALYRIKRDSRHFAKRQLTWFRREKEVTWIPKNEFQYDEKKMLSFIEEELRNKGILENE